MNCKYQPINIVLKVFFYEIDYILKRTIVFSFVIPLS